MLRGIATPLAQRDAKKRCPEALVEQTYQRRRGRVQPEMFPATGIEAASPRGAGDQAELDEIGLDHLLDRVARFAEARGERLHPDRAAAIDVGDHRQVTPVHRVEPEAVDLEPVERGIAGRSPARR